MTRGLKFIQVPLVSPDFRSILHRVFVQFAHLTTLRNVDHLNRVDWLGVLMIWYRARISSDLKTLIPLLSYLWRYLYFANAVT